jgi:hypothetical protein
MPDQRSLLWSKGANLREVAVAPSKIILSTGFVFAHWQDEVPLPRHRDLDDLSHFLSSEVGIPRLRSHKSENYLGRKYIVAYLVD